MAVDLLSSVKDLGCPRRGRRAEGCAEGQAERPQTYRQGRQTVTAGRIQRRRAGRDDIDHSWLFLPNFCNDVLSSANLSQSEYDRREEQQRSNRSKREHREIASRGRGRDRLQGTVPDGARADVFPMERMSRQMIAMGRHVSRECHVSREGPEPRKIECRDCDEEGHLSKDCEKPVGITRIKCNNCAPELRRRPPQPPPNHSYGEGVCDNYLR
ncbi:zinc knuckle [Colletotrichum acutatum]